MKQKLLFLFSILLTGSINFLSAQQLQGPRGEQFTVKVVADRLSDPWEVTYGPDHYLWVTEARGYQVSRINPVSGQKTVLLDLTTERQFPRYDKLPKEAGGKPWPQGGLMGMALHPQLLSGKPYVYLVYVYQFSGANEKGDGGKPNFGGYYFTTKIVRYTYNVSTQKLVKPTILCDTIPNSSDHNGGRLLIAPINGKPYLFYSIGDLGAGQFGNAGRPNHAQQTSSYEGKILRFNVEPDTQETGFDAWIPNDNPFNTKTQKAVYSYGHRNPQGLAYAVINGAGHIYSSEHGPFSDDEVNLIEKGKNYGHPLIIGYADGNYNGLAAGVSDHESLPGKWHTTYPLIKNEQATAKAMGTTYRNPLKTLYPNSADFLKGLFKKIQGGDNGEWSSEAPSSIAVYTASAIPGWQNSLLLPTLKGKQLVRLKLSANGEKVISDTINYFKSNSRYRDIALSPDGRKIYLAVDSSSISSGPTETNPQKSSCRGCILEFTYQSGGHEEPSERPVKVKAPYLRPKD